MIVLDIVAGIALLGVAITVRHSLRLAGLALLSSKARSSVGSRRCRSTCSMSAAEVERMLFRDRLRSHAEDRERYQRTKRERAGARWSYVQDYADSKSPVVEQIIANALYITLSVGVPTPPRPESVEDL